uniref:ANK_REP_REGION domain-containing protein n=1 Tax=Rhabditophanes sp. KR3021 TaxID=114890 RepID=A0AC35U5Y8_9BILA
MGQVKSKLKARFGGGGRAGHFDPDEKWSNLYREREKNHLYKWVGVRSGGELIQTFEKEGEEGVLRFAAEKIEPMLFNNGTEPQLIKYSDYNKWKTSVNVQLGKNENEESSEQINKKFREHYSQWKLNKRGVSGETVLHLLLNREEASCGEVARILITKYPGLANDIYLGDEMFGQSALHLAIVHDDYDTIQLLLKCNADVTARASGNFFMPETSGTGKNIDYQGYAYYGEYPLAFAACFGNKDIYDLLIQAGADPNNQDMFGNTILHMCVINYSSSMYSYAVRHWKMPAHQHIINNAGYTPLTLASKLGRRQIFEEMLELMKVEFWRFSDMTCSAYPLTALDTIKPDGSTNYDSALMTVINGNTNEHLEMIGSDVIQRLLDDKWKSFGTRKLIERSALLAVHLFCLCIVVYLRPTETERLYMESPHWDDIYEEFDCANYEGLTKGLFVLYMFVMPIMMINILIAMMGNTYTTIITQAEKAWRQQRAQIVMVLERSIDKDKLAACQLEYCIKLNEHTEQNNNPNQSSVEVERRGLMVIKQTKKTRAKQRKQAITNWKSIGRKVIQTVGKIGVDQSCLILHSHDKIFSDGDMIVSSFVQSHIHRTAQLHAKEEAKKEEKEKEKIPFIDDQSEPQLESNSNETTITSIATNSAKTSHASTHQQSLDTVDEEMDNLISHIERRSALNHPHSISSLSITDLEQMSKGVESDLEGSASSIGSKSKSATKPTLTKLVSRIDLNSAPIVPINLVPNKKKNFSTSEIVAENIALNRSNVITPPNVPNFLPNIPARNFPIINSLRNRHAHFNDSRPAISFPDHTSNLSRVDSFKRSSGSGTTSSESGD